MGVIVGTSPKDPGLLGNMSYKWELLLPPPFMVPEKIKPPISWGEVLGGGLGTDSRFPWVPGRKG